MKCAPEYWIWMQRCLGQGADAEELLAYFEDPKTLYDTNHMDWLRSGVMSVKTYEKLTAYSPSQSEKIMSDCFSHGWHIITPDDDAYPERFRNMVTKPLVLYVYGDPGVLNSAVSVSMVGARDVSDYGSAVAHGLAYDIAKAGATVVSGGALGVDSASHRGAIKAGGKTIAFLGNGLGSTYLMENKPLRRSIAENGAVVTEYLPFTSPTRRTFPIRNRLIAGISLGTVVVEAGRKSGSLITADFARKLGRDVYAVPGNILDKRFAGTNDLIREGANIVFSAYDILARYADIYEEHITMPRNDTLTVRSGRDKIDNITFDDYDDYVEKTKNTISAADTAKKTKKEQPIPEKDRKTDVPERQEIPEYASEDAKKLFAFIEKEPKIVDELVISSGMPVQTVLSSLTELEIYGLVKVYDGKRYGIT